MAAIIRLKRRRDEDQADSLVLVCKKLKLINEKTIPKTAETERIESKFKFAGTVDQIEDSSLTQTVRKAIKRCKLENEQNKYEGKSSEPPKKLNNAISKGYTITGQKTAKDLDSLSNCDQILASEDSKYFLFDIEKIDSTDRTKYQTTENELCCNEKPMIREKLSEENNYVFDIYYMNDYKFDFSLLQNIESVEAFKETYDFQYIEDDEDVYDNEDDENDEINWRNDYPDEYSCFYTPDNDDTGYDLHENDDLNYAINHVGDESLKEIESHFSDKLNFDGENCYNCDDKFVHPMQNSHYNFYKRNYFK